MEKSGVEAERVPTQETDKGKDKGFISEFSRKTSEDLETTKMRTWRQGSRTKLEERARNNKGGTNSEEKG
jgi:hypothetical protein